MITTEEFHALVKPKAKAKYGNKKIMVAGMTFDSKGEAKRYLELVDLQRRGLISNLRRQIAFKLQPSFKAPGGETIRKMEYIVDFTYTERGKPVCEDYKGFQNEVSKLKIKLFKFKYPGYEFRISRK